jgi:predicted nucleic acid-binding protein
MDFVLDSSVAMGWLLQSQASRLTIAAEDALMEGTVWVPDHFGMEMVRALRSHERRGLLSPPAVDSAVMHLRRLPLKPDPERMVHRLADIIRLARHHALRVADAPYLDLALRLNMPLATRDEVLAKAAVQADARLFTA